MLRLLLDANISPVVAREVRRHLPGCPIQALSAWNGGVLLDASDEEILQAALLEHVTLVTRDVSTIRPLVIAWTVEGRQHGGVIFVDDRTIPEGNVGALVRAICTYWSREHMEDWRGRQEFLPRS